MYTYELYEMQPGKFGFRIKYDDNVLIYQDYQPDVEGNVLMSKDVAEAQAQIIIGRLQ